MPGALRQFGSTTVAAFELVVHPADLAPLHDCK
jgi:hypothetical protein